MAKVINKYAENVMLRSVNRLISKYGHEVILRQPRDGQQTLDTQSRATFGRFKVTLGEEWFVINNNYRVRLRADSFPYIIQPNDLIIVNGATLTVVVARKISPDGATAIVWELECSGDTIPADASNAAVPTILAPANETSFYPAVETIGDLSSVAVSVSSYVVLSGETEYLNTDWQIAEDEEFATILQDGNTVGFNWTTPVILDNPKNYWVRARHNGTDGVQTAWSAANLFNLGQIGAVPTFDIQTPTMDFPVDSNGYADTTYTRADQYKPYGPWRIVPGLSAFASDTGKVFGATRWQVATDPDFTNIVSEGDSVGGFDYTTYEDIPYNYWMMPNYKWPLEDEVQYYIRGKYVADDSVTESEWTTTVAFKIDANRPPAGGSVATPTLVTSINATTKYMSTNQTYKKTIDGVVKYTAAPQLSNFSGVSPANEVDHGYWQVSTDSTFASGMVWEGKSVDGYYTDIGSRDADTLIMKNPDGTVMYPLALNVSYFVRAKYIATNLQESAWSATYEFKVNPAE